MGLPRAGRGGVGSNTDSLKYPTCPPTKDDGVCTEAVIVYTSSHDRKTHGGTNTSSLLASFPHFNIGFAIEALNDSFEIVDASRDSFNLRTSEIVSERLH